MRHVLASPLRLSVATWCMAVALYLTVATVDSGRAQAPGVAGAAGQGEPRGGGAPEGRAQGPGRAGGAAATDTLGTGPWDLGPGRGRIRVTVVTRGVDRPWGIAFVPDGSMLVTERPGRLRVIRNGVLDPTPLGPLPKMLATGLGGLLDIALHPQFAENRLIYFTYSKPSDDPAHCPDTRQCSATTAVARARWDGGSSLTTVEDVLVMDAWHGGPGSPQGVGPASGSYGSRLAWGAEGLLYVTSGERNYPEGAQDPSSHLGKILRIRDDGTVPPDNPFVKTPGYKPEIYTLGHRNPLGLAFNPLSGDLWSTEQGPQGGDELNLILAGRNHGWPRVSLGRHYDGTPVGEGFSARGFEDPVVFWVPAIAVSGLSFYTGDKFPAWQGHAFVGGMRNNTGQHVQRIQFNPRGLPVGREIMLGELRQRIREVKPGPDGYIYVLTDETAGAVMRIEPPPAQ